jgi:hypothetical protein
MAIRYIFDKQHFSATGIVVNFKYGYDHFPFLNCWLLGASKEPVLFSSLKNRSRFNELKPRRANVFGSFFKKNKNISSRIMRSYGLCFFSGMRKVGNLKESAF